MLRKHLQRLEQPLEGENKFETDHDLQSEDENIQLENDDNGMPFFLPFLLKFWIFFLLRLLQ